MSQIIYKNGCWTCLKAREDPTEQYICPEMEQHWKEAKEMEFTPLVFMK